MLVVSVSKVLLEHITQGCFGATRAEVNSGNRDDVTHKP